MQISTLGRKPTFALFAGALLVLGIVIWLATRFISPAPPVRIDMTTGAIDGAAHQFALKYQAYFKANGVELRLLPSGGSVQNLERLNAGIPVGFVQSGLGTLALDAQNADSDTPLRSLGVVGYEPVWLFTLSPTLARTLSKGLTGLAGKRVAIGAEGSGTRKVALELLQAYGITPAQAALTNDGGLVAANALLARSIDALIVIGAPQTPAVQLLLKRPETQLVAIAHAEGLTRRLPYLSLVTLKAGSVDPGRDRPSEDITLMSTTSNLVVRQELHPALGYLLLEATREVHKGATLLNRPGEFPNPLATDFPLADEARRYYRDGRPFLQRYMPYWVANALQRFLLVLVPLLAIAIPLFKIIPLLYGFREKSRLNRRYGLLLDLERKITSRTLTAQELADARVQLDQIEHDVSGMKFPLDFSDRVYTLRQHVDYVRGHLQAHSRDTAA